MSCASGSARTRCGSWETSCGLAQIETLRQLIRDKFQKDHRLCPTAEDTLLGLLALAFTGRASSVEQATTVLLEAHSGKGVQ